MSTSSTTAGHHLSPVEQSCWTDTETGVTEETKFLGLPGQQILAFLHRPTSRAVVGGVVICGSLFEDFQINYRREVLVARRLAQRGFATVRFHYRSVGNSDGLPSGAVSFDSMVEDASTAATWLAARAGITRPVMCGSRLGALVAAHLAARGGHAPLVLWAPILSGGDFFRGMSRASLLAGVRAEARKKQSSASTEGRLRTEASVEMLANRVHRSSYEDLGSRSLPEAPGPGQQVLLVQLATGDALTAGPQALVSRWRAAGAVVDVLMVRARQVWTVPDEWQPEEDRAPTLALVEGISTWVDGMASATP